jgi:hypothetical protein
MWMEGECRGVASDREVTSSQESGSVSPLDFSLTWDALPQSEAFKHPISPAFCVVLGFQGLAQQNWGPLLLLTAPQLLFEVELCPLSSSQHLFLCYYLPTTTQETADCRLQNPGRR